MIDLREGRDGALAAAAARALLDRDRGRNTEYGVDVRSGRRLYELTRVGIQRLQIAALAFVEEDIERQSRFAGTGDAGDDGEPVARDLHIDVFQVVLSGVMDHDRVVCARVAAAVGDFRFGDPQDLAAGGPILGRRPGLDSTAADGLLILGERLAGEGSRVGANLRGGARTN